MHLYNQAYMHQEQSSDRGSLKEVDLWRFWETPLSQVDLARALKKSKNLTIGYLPGGVYYVRFYSV
jgi:hypothetical protein